MAITPVKALLFAAGVAVAVVGAAYVSGALDPLFRPAPSSKVAASPAQPAAGQQGDGAASGTQARLPTAVAPQSTTMKPAAPAAATPETRDVTNPAAPEPAAQEASPPSQTPATTATKVIAPTFDVVRVEGDGSVVIAGKAAPDARVEIVHGSAVLGSAVADAGGDFAIVLEEPLKPGDYQLVLRATAPDGSAATSEQTAVVSVPQKPDGQVLAMVEEPGKPAELLTVPRPETSATENSAPKDNNEAAGGGQATPVQPAVPSEQATPSEEATPAPTASPATTVAGPAVVVEAVEIDGNKIFVAGLADPGRKVRAYANDVLLGDAKTSPDGHFLVEASRDLPVGEYTIRVDALDADGARVVARAAVPFQREPGETMAAVAPSADAKPAEAKPEEQDAQSAPSAATSAQAGGEAQQPAAPAEAPSSGNSASGSQAAAAPAPAEPQSPAVPETVSPKLEHADGAVIIRRGDSLWRISRRVYGHGIRYSTIYLANQDQIRDPDMIWPGQVFKVPEQSREGDAADMDALGDQATTTAPAQ